MNKEYDKKYFFYYHDALKIYGALKLCTVMYVLKPLFLTPSRIFFSNMYMKKC